MCVLPHIGGMLASTLCYSTASENLVGVKIITNTKVWEEVRTDWLSEEIRNLKTALYKLLLLTTHPAPSHLRPTQLRMLLLHPNLSKASLFKPSQEVPISFKYFFVTSFHPNRGRPAFWLALDGSPKRTMFGNLQSFIHRTSPSHHPFSCYILRK